MHVNAYLTSLRKMYLYSYKSFSLALGQFNHPSLPHVQFVEPSKLAVLAKKAYEGHNVLYRIFHTHCRPPKIQQRSVRLDLCYKNSDRLQNLATNCLIIKINT